MLSYLRLVFLQNELEVKMLQLVWGALQLHCAPESSGKLQWFVYFEAGIV